MANPTIRLNVPSPVKRHEVVEIKTMIMHPMETGFRIDSMGEPLPKKIIHTFECLYNGVQVVRLELNSGIAANPFISFFIQANESGELVFKWHDDDGSIYSRSAAIEVV